MCCELYQLLNCGCAGGITLPEFVTACSDSTGTVAGTSTATCGCNGTAAGDTTATCGCGCQCGCCDRCRCGSNCCT